MDLITLTQAKNYANKVAAGFSSVEVDGTNINFTLNDGSKATVIVPVPADGKDGAAGISVVNLSIDTDGSLLCHMSDGSIIDAGFVPTVDPDLTNYYTKEEINSLFGKTFLWDGLSGEENPDNLSLFDEFYANFVASEGKTRLLVKTPNAQNPTYMNANVQVDPTQGDKIRLTVDTFSGSSYNVDYNNTEYNLFSYYASIIIENEKCIEVSELEYNEDKLNFLSTTDNYDGYYSPVSEGSPVSKGYMVETLKEGKYSISPDQLEKEFQRVLTEPIITINEEDPTEIEFVRYEGETGGTYGFTLKQMPWGDDYVSTNGAHDNSYALGKFILNNPGEKTIRVSIDYSLECKSTDTAVFSKLDTTVAANSWNDSENAYKVITGETSTYGSVMYDIPSGQHFVTFKYMVGWKSTGEGENDALTVSFGDTQGAVQEHYLSTQQFVKDYVTGEVDSKLNTKANIADVYTKSEVDNKVSSIYKYKGSVANKEALPTENLAIGDVYNLEDTGMNVAYTGEKWDELGVNIDLSSYYTKTEVNELPLIKGLKYNTTKNSLYTNAIGQSATASGYHSIALGPLARAKGNRSVAIGHDCRADKDYCTAIGYSTIADGTNSIAVGYEAVAHGDNQIALGHFNAGDQINLLVVGNGTSSTTRSNAHTLSKSGVAWFRGDVYTGGTSISGATKLAKVTELNTKVDKIEGKGLSTNDFTNDLNTKLAGIAAGAEVNKIDVIKINGEAAEIVNKAIDITIPGSKTYTYQPLIQRSPAIEVTNEEYCFTQNNNVFSIENPGENSQSYITYINITEQDIINIMLNISILPTNTDDSFLETGCTLSIYKNPSSDNTKVFTSSTVIKKSLNIPVNTGDQLMLDWYSNGNMPYRNAIFKVEIDGYIKNEINTTEVENFIYENMSQLNRYTGYKMVDLSNNFFNIRNEVLPDVYVDENQGSNNVINIPLRKNQEYRISLENNNNESQTINIGFMDENILNERARYQTKLVLQTSYRKNVTYTFNVMSNWGEWYFYGDDVVDHIFTPQRLKFYEITFYFNGFMMCGEVKGLPYPEPAV